MRKYQQYYKKQLRKKKKSIFKNRYFWFILLSIFLLFGMFYFLFFSPVFQIDKIKIEGTHFVDKNKVEGLAELKSDRKIFFFPTKSLFALSKKKLRSSILDNFFPAQEVIIKKHFFHKSLSILIKEKKPQAICCGQEKCFFVDKEGIIFQIAPLKINASTTDLAMPIVHFSNKIEIKKKVLETKTLRQIISIFSDIKKQEKLDVKEFEIFSSTIKATLSDQTIIYFSSQKDVNLKLDNLFIFLENQASLNNQIETKEKQKLPDNNSFEYIDLRFDKIFYK